MYTHNNLSPFCSLRTQITNLGGSVKMVEVVPLSEATQSPCNTRGEDPPATGGGRVTSGLSVPEKRRVQDRINKVLMEIESKKVAVKNLRITLDKIDMSE